jgi:hypothetical protein
MAILKHPPRVAEQVYVPSREGSKNCPTWTGGLATVKEVIPDSLLGHRYVWIVFEEMSSIRFSWEFLQDLPENVNNNFGRGDG